jgi:hypothetical protein
MIGYSTRLRITYEENNISANNENTIEIMCGLYTGFVVCLVVKDFSIQIHFIICKFARIDAAFSNSLSTIKYELKQDRRIV